jgi:hypothetical protein
MQNALAPRCFEEALTASRARILDRAVQIASTSGSVRQTALREALPPTSSIIPALLPAWTRQKQRSLRRRPRSARDQGSARASAFIARPAGVVPSSKPETNRGERNASGGSSRMCCLDLSRIIGVLCASNMDGP